MYFSFHFICIFVFIFACMCMSVPHVCAVSSCRGQKRILEPLGLEWQIVVSPHLWVLGIKAGFSAGETSAVSHGATEPRLQPFLSF